MLQNNVFMRVSLMCLSLHAQHQHECKMVAVVLFLRSDRQNLYFSLITRIPSFKIIMINERLAF